jgi:hypothetical protein
MIFSLDFHNLLDYRIFIGIKSCSSFFIKNINLLYQIKTLIL